MRAELLALAEHRTRLVARARDERTTLDSMLAPVDAAAALAGSVKRVAGGLAEQAARYPWFVAAGIALLAALRPKRAASWLARGWSLWRLYRGAQGMWLRVVDPGSNAGVRPGAPRRTA
jgi:uncharacterized MAPEG superfamily protein